MTLMDTINRAIEMALTGAKITSASPGHVNTVFLLEEMDHTNLEDEIRSIIQEEIELSEIEAIKAPDELTGGKSGISSQVEKDVSSLGETPSKDEIRSIIQEEIELSEIEAIKAPDKLTGGESGISSQVEKDLSSLGETLENLKKSPFGTMSSLTHSQVSNLQSFSKDPFKFIFGSVFKKFAKGAGIIILATIIFEAVQLIISELMKPGRALDIKFKRVAKDEILLFNSREEQAELRQGFRTVIITTMQFLSGSEARGQISGNLYNPSAIPMNRIDPRKVIPAIQETQNASRGNRFSRGRRRFG